MLGALYFVVAVVGSALAAPLTSATAQSGMGTKPTVTIASGVIHGTSSALPSATVNQFLGVPFAQSPPKRFTPPQDPAAWKSPLAATQVKPACVQQFNYPQSERDFVMKIFNNPGLPPPAESEDCLYLNVYAPVGAAPANGWPVMFWIYGGNLQFGDAGLHYYDGSIMAANQKVVVVTTNYRTNAFGYPGSPQIPTNQQNLGFLDQRKALAWVTENVHAFNGDPTKVTLFGESAGGYSVKQLLAVPPSPLPFRAAIMESEAVGTFGQNGSDSTSWEQLVAGVGCSAAASQLDCVRGVPASSIKSYIEHNSLTFAPTFDGVTCVKDVRPAISGKTWANVPFLIGTNANEGRVFATAAGLTPDAGESSVASFLNTTFPGDTALQTALLTLYPTWLTKSAYELVSQVITDFIFTCPARDVAADAVAAGYHAWRYLYNGSFPNTQLFADAGAYHSVEIPAVFGTYPTANATRDQAILSQTMQAAWGRFATNPTGGPGWPGVGTAGGQELQDFGIGGTGRAQTVALSTVDWPCFIYEPVIDAEGI